MYSFALNIWSASSQVAWAQEDISDKLQLDMTEIKFSGETKKGSGDAFLRARVSYESNQEISDTGEHATYHVAAVSAKIPSKAATNQYTADSEEFVDSWMLGVSYGNWRTNDVQLDGTAPVYRLVQFSAEAGIASFEYQPVEATAPVEALRIPFAAQFDLQQLWLPEVDRKHALGVMVRYARSYKEASQMAVWIPGTVEPIALPLSIVAPPAASDMLSLRVHGFWEIGERGAPIAIGPALAGSLLGDLDNAGLGNGVPTVRPEVWLYAMPGESAGVNTRIGLAPYANVVLAEDLEATLGVVIDLRVGMAQPWVY